MIWQGHATNGQGNVRVYRVDVSMRSGMMEFQGRAQWLAGIEACEEAPSEATRVDGGYNGRWYREY